MPGWISSKKSLRPPGPAERLELERDIEEELRFHLDMRALENQAGGMDTEAAHADARARFGDVAQIKAQCLHIQQQHPWYRVAEAARSLGTLALGIGGVCVVFLVLNAVLFRLPLTYHEDHDWLAVWWQHEDGRLNSNSSLQDFLAWQKEQTVFDAMTLAQYDAVNLGSANKAPAHGRVKRVSRGYFAHHGAAPVLGRGFLPEEFAIGATPVAVLSHDLWQRRYQGRHDVLDDSLLINGTPHAIVGVMPAAFQMYFKTDAFAPFRFAPDEVGPARTYLVAGRLREGVTPAAATAVLQRLHGADDPAWRVKLRPVQEVYGEPVQSQLFVYLGLMALLLLLACIHVFRQHWSRIVWQQRIGMREMADGSASRVAMAGLGESLLITLAAGLLGLGLARLLVAHLLGPLLGDFAHLFDVHIDARVLGFTLSLSVMLGLAMGLWPFIMLRKRTGPIVCGSTRSQGRRTEGVLMALEIALALVLLVTAGLMGRGLLDRHNNEPGFDPDGVLTMPIALSGPHYATGRAQAAYFLDVFNRLDALPGIQAVSLTLALPGIDQQPRVSVLLDRQATAQQAVHFNVVGTDYLDLMGVALHRGRLFEPEDAGRAVGVTVVNEAMANHLWPGKNPVGQHLFLNNASRERIEVIGVVANVRQGGWHQKATPAMYGLYWRMAGPTMHLVVKAGTAPVALAASIEETLRPIDTQVPLEPLVLMSDLLAAQARTDFLFVAVFTVLALIALAMAAISLHRSMVHTIYLRSREIGMRRLLGATTYDVQVLALRPMLGRLVAGMMIGLFGAALITPFFAGLLFEGDPLDPVAYASGAVLLAGALLAVACTSARKAAHLDPILALRYG